MRQPATGMGRQIKEQHRMSHLITCLYGMLLGLALGLGVGLIPAKQAQHTAARVAAHCGDPAFTLETETHE